MAHASHAVDVYKGALGKFRAADQALRALLARAGEILGMLDAWPPVHFANMKLPALPGPGGGLPTADYVAPGQWPTEQQIVDALDRWHRTRKEAHDTWAAVPPPDRAGLETPA
jgi:hypothetical protein